MSLPHVVLGLLQEEPMTGYDLARVLGTELDPVWSAGFSQIYPALARLRRSGWVHLRALGPRRGPGRHLYRLTAAGRRELARWLEAAPAARRQHDPLLVRLAFLGRLGAAARRVAIAAHAAAVAAEIARVRALPAPAGGRALPRRAALERLEATRRYLHGLGREAPARTTSRKKK